MKFLSMNKILCIRLGYLGDVLLCDPVLRAIKNQFPGVQIHFLTDITCEELRGTQVQIDHWHFYNGGKRSLAAALWKENFLTPRDLSVFCCLKK
jgi:ADP-heptose:LPS heptosyltransferase